MTFEKINANTLPQHQTEYGAGYGPYYSSENGYFNEADVDGDGELDLLIPYGEDASWGAPLDGTMVVHWDALDPLADNYGEKRPYSYSGNGIEEFFETGVSFNNSVAIDGGNEFTTFRLSYTNTTATGVLPNSEMKKNSFSFSGTHKMTEKFKVSTSASYTNTYMLGRGGTGYDGQNVVQAFGQWYQTSLDMNRLKNYKQVNGDQYTWNNNAWDDLDPHYFNNPYWVRYENYQDDERNRIIGNINLDYELTDWLSVNGQISNDYYNYTQEERVAVNSLEVPEYRKKLRTFNETNYQFLTNLKKRFGSDFSINGLVGVNLRRQHTTLQDVGTSGGLIVDGIYSISNSSSSALAQDEYDRNLIQQSVFGSVSLGWKDIVFVDVTGRNDWSSTLPVENNSYFYPSISGSFVFTELTPLADNSILSFGKLRLNYAQVGNDADPHLTEIYYDGVYNAQQAGTTEVPLYSFNGASLFSLPTRLNNLDLKPEEQKSIEAGIDLRFLNERIGLDITAYKTSTFNQILDAPISYSAGYGFKWINAGEIENKGLEVVLRATPVKTKDFRWDVNVNWSKNENMVVKLADDLPSYQLASGFFITINAEEGQPYGVIKGPNYLFHENGQPIVDEDGFWAVSENDEVLGDPNPDWLMGITNSLTYKGFSVGFLIDMQKGGDVFSQNHMFGRATGVFEETAGLNDLGNPKRDPVSEGGGMRLDGVQADGTPNDVYGPASQWGGVWKYSSAPMATNVFDASYVKLRELTINYRVPSSVLSKIPFSSMSVGFVGRNLAILASNVDSMDPEATQSAGNIQGFSRGANPSTRTYGFTINLGL